MACDVKLVRASAELSDVAPSELDTNGKESVDVPYVAGNVRVVELVPAVEPVTVWLHVLDVFKKTAVANGKSSVVDVFPSESITTGSVFAGFVGGSV